MNDLKIIDMDISKKILRAINEGVINALSFDDELPDTEDVHMHKISNDTISANLEDILDRKYYLAKIDGEIPDPLLITITNIKLAIKSYEAYGITYNPHLDGDDFKRFIERIVYINNQAFQNANLNWIDTSEVTIMKDLFSSTLFDGDISKWDVSNVTNMSSMFFKSTYTGKNNDLSEWNLLSVHAMYDMFNNSCYQGSFDFIPDDRLFDKNTYTAIWAAGIFGDIADRKNVYDWLKNRIKLFRSLTSVASLVNDYRSKILPYYIMNGGKLLQFDIDTIINYRHTLDEDTYKDAINDIANTVNIDNTNYPTMLHILKEMKLVGLTHLTDYPNIIRRLTKEIKNGLEIDRRYAKDDEIYDILVNNEPFQDFLEEYKSIKIFDNGLLTVYQFVKRYE